MDINFVRLSGKLGQDVEVKLTSNGYSYCRFGIATNEYYKKGDERKNITTWHNVNAWGNLAAQCDGFKKGDHLYIEGRIKTKRVNEKILKIVEPRKIIRFPKKSHQKIEETGKRMLSHDEISNGLKEILNTLSL